MTHGAFQAHPTIVTGEENGARGVRYGYSRPSHTAATAILVLFSHPGTSGAGGVLSPPSILTIFSDTNSSSLGLLLYSTTPPLLPL